MEQAPRPIRVRRVTRFVRGVDSRERPGTVVRNPDRAESGRRTTGRVPRGITTGAASTSAETSAAIISFYTARPEPFRRTPLRESRSVSALPHSVAAASRPHGQLELICGPMFSGKSEELMRRLRRVGYARKSAILVKPAIDDRYSVDEVVSHEGQRMAARVVRTPEAILQLAAGADVVGVDEGQFLDDSLIDVCEALVAGACGW